VLSRPSRATSVVVKSMRIQLHDGFQDDPVVIRLNGREVFRKAGVTSKRLTGVAETLELDTPAGPADVEIELPRRRLTEKVRVEQGKDNIVFYVEEGRLMHRVSAAPFGSA
jgi:hypothetical protein